MMIRCALSNVHWETASKALSGGMATRVQPLKDSSGRISIHPEASDAKASFVCAHSGAESRNEIAMINAQRDFIPTPPRIQLPNLRRTLSASPAGAERSSAMRDVTGHPPNHPALIDSRPWRADQEAGMSSDTVPRRRF